METQGVQLYSLLSASVIAGLVLVIPMWRILRRAGFHPAWSLLVFVPTIGLLAVLAVLAFNRWPADRLPREVES